jgi:uncharacterized protein YlxW (UPF0749 family)
MMRMKAWAPQLLVTLLCLGLGALLVVQLRTENAARQAARSEGWEFVVADLVDSNSRLRQEIKTLETQLTGLQDVEGGAVVLQSLVDEVNRLRITNGLIEVSGPGVEVLIDGPISVLDLHDLINELRNAGAEALALNEKRLVAWSAISTDGEHVTVEGRPVQPPYRLQAIGDVHTLEVAMTRPGGLVDLLHQADRQVSLAVNPVERLTLPVHEQPFQFVYSIPVE